MNAAVFQGSAFIVAALVPGVLIAILFGTSRRDLLISLPLGCGLFYILGNYSSFIGLPFGKLWYLGVISVLMYCAVQRRGNLQWLREKYTVSQKIALISSIAVGVYFFVIWARAAGHFGQLLPNHDAMYHSYVIRNIIDTQSTNLSDALRLFPLGTGTAANFYPLGLHSMIAVACQMTGLSINAAMNLVTIILAITVFPLSMYIWTRELLTDSKLTAFITPLSVVMLSSVFPWSPLSWGGMPAIVAMCFAPVVAVAVTRVLCAPSKRGLAITVLALVGMFSIHPTELVLVILLTAVLLFRREEIPYKNVLRCGIQIAVISFIAMIPVIFATVGGAAERNLDYQPVLEIANTIGNSLLFSLTGFALPIATMLLVFGIIQSNRNSNSVITWSLAVLVVTTVLAAGFPRNVIVRLITKPWYGQVLRLNYNVVYFAVPLVACGIIWLLSFNKSLLVRFLSIGVTVLVVFFGAMQVHRADRLLLESWYNGLIPVNQNSITAFHWISKNISEDEYVLTDYDGVDGSTWMYALAGVRPVMYGAIADNSRDQLRAQKIEVLANIGKLSLRPDLVEFLRMNYIKYIYFDERTNAISPQHSFSIEELRSDAALENVFSLGNAQVFRVNY